MSYIEFIIEQKIMAYFYSVFFKMKCALKERNDKQRLERDSILTLKGVAISS